MRAPRVSHQLVEWAEAAGYSLTPEDHSGAALFWSDPGGELRFYVRDQVDGNLVLTRAERASEEQFELAGASMDVIERYLYGVFGWARRSKLRLQRIKAPRRVEEIVDGFEISDPDSEGYRPLLKDGAMVAIARGKISGLTILIELSHLISSPVEMIRASYDDADGRPLFHV